MNGSQVSDIVSTHYNRPFRFRQNPSTVSISTHFNQIINAASGKYFVMLADDDELSPNYVSELVRRLEQHPEASVAIAMQEIIDENGAVIRRSKDALPEILSAWTLSEPPGILMLMDLSVCHNLLRTDQLHAVRDTLNLLEDA
jgi:hypothetical protein